MGCEQMSHAREPEIGMRMGRETGYLYHGVMNVESGALRIEERYSVCGHGRRER